MTSWKIPLFKMYNDENDVKSVSSVIKRGMFWGLSSETIEFERKIAKVIGVKFCVIFNSGTSALHALMIAYGFKKSDEIIVPSFSFNATANAPLFVESVPKFADIELETFGLDPIDVEKKITRKTKAMIPIHYGGNMCKISELRKIARDSKILLIEDAAESLGSKFRGKVAGSFGDSSILSFAWNKIITTGEGGAALTNSKKIYEKLLLIRSHGRIDKENYFITSKKSEYITLGYNWRMSAINVALGLSQLKKLDKLIHLRRHNSHYLSTKLEEISEIRTPRELKNVFHTYMMYTIYVESGRKVRNQLQEFLCKQGIQTKINFSPIHLTKFYSKKFGYSKNFLKNTELVSNHILTLPMFPHFKKSEMDYVVENIKKFF